MSKRGGLVVDRKYWDGKEAITVDPGRQEFNAETLEERLSKPIVIEASVQKRETVRIEEFVVKPKTYHVAGYEKFKQETDPLFLLADREYVKEMIEAQRQEALRKIKERNKDVYDEDKELRESSGNEKEKVQRGLSCYGEAHNELQSLMNDVAKLESKKAWGYNDPDGPEIKWARRVLDYQIRPCLKDCLAGRKKCSPGNEHPRIWPPRACAHCTVGASEPIVDEATSFILSAALVGIARLRRSRGKKRWHH